MKNIQFKILALLVFVSIGLSSCKKDGDIAVVLPKAGLNTINATNYAINAYQNGTRLNNLGSIGTGGKSGYFAVNAGTQQYQIKKAGPDNPDYLISDLAFQLDSGKAYSLFVAGDTPDKVFMINDVVPTVAGTMAIIRFVNTLPGTTNLDVSIGSTSYPNMAFKAFTAFSGINNGATSLKIYQSGAATPIIDQTINLAAGTIYTIFTTGTLSGTGTDKLTARMVINEL
ncbi:MAG: DUF4397 domain-containing protein [Sphingobacteriaceae bacterium]|nr:MAG: DUF4397 domain-containing protein [Sphingobacteriaceae bacterium]